MKGKANPYIWLEGEVQHDPRRVTRISHSFSDHPLLQLHSLKQLGERFAAEGRGQVKFMRSGATSSDKLEILTEHDQGLSVSEVFDRIQEPGSWVSLYHVQTDSTYRPLIHEILNSIASQIRTSDPGIFDADGFIFVSSAPSATPFHFDRENNFFLQIRGRKRVSVWDPSDRVVVPETEIEDKIGLGQPSRVRFDPVHFHRAALNQELTEGEGVYIPSTAGHTTNTQVSASGEETPYSISIGVVYYTCATRRAAYCYAINQYLRRFGVAPRPPYLSPLRDALKYPFGRALVMAKKFALGFKIPGGM